LSKPLSALLTVLVFPKERLTRAARTMDIA
jgi:hypothetical protein